MTITTEEFIVHFHSLNGTTIGERHKNLFLLLNQIKQAGSTNLDFSAIQPKTPLEEKLKVETLIYFRKVPELVELLKCENPILIHRILKSSSWFLEEAFRNITGEQLVTLIFPYVSFNTKVKIVNKLSEHLKNTQQADAFYEAIERKYGIYLASKLLPACSSDLIMNCFKSNRINLTPRQLEAIIRKYPEITEDILKTLSNRASLSKDYKKIFIFLAKHNTSLFLKLYKEYDVALNLGWRVTDKLIQANKESFIKSPTKYYEILHKKQIAKSLKSEYQHFFLNLFPKSIEQFINHYDMIFSVLKEMPAKMQDVNLLLSTFEKLYGSQIWDHPTFVKPEMLKMLTSDERDKRLKIEYKPATMSEDEWSSYWKTEKAIPFLKNRISLSSSIKTRTELIELLVKTCKINEDRVALASVCKYMLKQHRNDHISVRLAFIKTLKKNFKLEHLEKEHWAPINELIQIFVVNDEPFYHTDVFLEGYIHHLFIHNLPVREQLIKWLKLRHGNLNIIKEKPQYEKQCLLTFGELIPETMESDHVNLFNMNFLNALISWNKRHPQDAISLFNYDNALKSLREIISETCYYMEPNTIINYCLRTKTNTEEKLNLLQIFLSNEDRYMDVEVLNWLIKYEPLFMLQNIDSVTQAVLRNYRAVPDCFFWKYCLNYSHLEIPMKAIEICLAIHQKDRESFKHNTTPKNAIVALSHLMSADQFLKFIVPYYPEQGKKLHAVVQQDIGGCLKNVNPPSSALDTILVFSKGDYLKLIQRSLYSLSGNVNENKLMPFFNVLMGRSVSVRKHALHLTFRVLDKEQVLNVLNRFMEGDKNASVRKFIFKYAFKYFVKNPSDYSWELVKVNLTAADPKDKETVLILMQFDKVPRQFFEKYIPFTWEFINKVPDPDGLWESDKAALLNSITSDVIHLLPKEFCKAVVNGYLFKCKEFTYFQAAVQSFTCKYIIYCDSQVEQEERLQSSFALLRDYILATWRNPELTFTGRNCTTNFIKEFCSEFLDKKCLNKNILITFAELWSNFLKPHEAFNEYLHLQFTLIYVENLALPLVSQKLAALCDALVHTYGPVVVELLYDKINDFSRYFLGCDSEVLEKNRFTFIENFIKPDSSVACLLLVILLLNKNVPVMQEAKSVYSTIIGMLEQKQDPVIQMHLHQHFKGTVN